MFAAAGQLMATQARRRPRRLLVMVFVVASLTTAVLSLDATVVCSPLWCSPPRPGSAPDPSARLRHHPSGQLRLAAAAGVDLTNLLAMSAVGLSFAGFAGLMAAPWLVAIAVEFVVFRWYFGTVLSVVAAPRTSDDGAPAKPVFALVVLGLTLAGFVASSPLHLEPFWAALSGVLALAIKRLANKAVPFEPSWSSWARPPMGGSWRSCWAWRSWCRRLSTMARPT